MYLVGKLLSAIGASEPITYRGDSFRSGKVGPFSEG